MVLARRRQTIFRKKRPSTARGRLQQSNNKKNKKKTSRFDNVVKGIIKKQGKTEAKPPMHRGGT